MAHMDYVEFGMVLKGQVRIVSIQLYNPTLVSVSWTQTKPKLGNDRHLASVFQLKTKSKHKSHKNQSKDRLPPIFELIPDHGLLEPGKKTNVQVSYSLNN